MGFLEGKSISLADPEAWKRPKARRFWKVMLLEGAASSSADSKY